MSKRVSNKKAKRIIFNSALRGRKLFWFGEPSEKFIANSIDEVIDLSREWIGDDDVEDIINNNDFGEVKIEMNPSLWFKLLLWNDDTGRSEPLINALNESGCYKVSTAYL